MAAVDRFAFDWEESQPPTTVIANPAQQGKAIHQLARCLLVDCFRPLCSFNGG